nr:hypothetical protein [Tanacetum cinerariifolium]
MISNEFAIKLCWDYEMKKGKKLVKKELIVALKRELYFVKFIINPEEDDFEPVVILGRSFIRLAKGVVNFGKSSDDWDQLLDFNFDDVLKFREELPQFVSKIRKSSHKKKRAMENLNLFYQDIGPSSSGGGHLTQKEEVCSIRRREALKRIKGEALKEKDDPGAFIFPIRLEGKVNENALADTGSDINTMPYRIYDTLRREEMKKIDDMLRIRLREAGSDEEIFIYVAWIIAFNINEPIYAELCHEFYSTYEFDEVSADDELQLKKIIKFRLGGRDHNLTLLEFARRLGLYQVVELEEKRNPILSVIHKMVTYGLCQRTTGYDKIQKNDLWLLNMFNARHQNGGCGKEFECLIYGRDLDTTTLRDLINSDSKLIPKDPQPGVPRVGIPRPPRASMHDLYDRMGRMEIRQDAIEQIEYRQSYH